MSESLHIGELPRGCQLCAQGRKSVLLITGRCPRRCYYCPLSDQKSGRDVIYINEWPTREVDEICEEIRLCGSHGVGITGGDPLLVIERTCEMIGELKRRFGRSFHIHLYTSLNLFVPRLLDPLHAAGLDEIRVHPDLDDDTLWERMANGTRHPWAFGMEIPVIPTMREQTERLIRHAIDHVSFINLNELEYSDTNAQHLTERGLHVREGSAIAGSHELATELIERFADTSITLHYCSAAFKDGVQLKNRILRRAQSIRLPFDEITDDGMLCRYALYPDELAPGVGYRERLAQQAPPVAERMRAERERLLRAHRLPDDALVLDERKPRLLLARETLERIKPALRHHALLPARVEEYPTHDAIEVELEFL